MSDGKRGRPPLPEGWKRIYFNASPAILEYYRRVQEAQNLATRGDAVRLVSDEARRTDRFLTGNDANLAELQT